MVLHRGNIEIPARFSFRPFEAYWTVSQAEIVGWGEEEPGVERRLGGILPEWVLVCVDVPSDSALGLTIPCTVEIDRTYIPSEVLRASESRQTTPDIAGRVFDLLVCRKDEFAEHVTTLKPGTKTKNARVMREEFLNQSEDTEGLCQFLNHWGMWRHGRGYRNSYLRRVWPVHQPQPYPFALEFPHHLVQMREKFKKALKGKPEPWLSAAHPLTFSQMDQPPYFLVERFYCVDAIEATITLDHLAGARFGICKRCRRLFERETQHKKNYCSRRCIQAANVKRWRDNQKKRNQKKITRRGHAKG